MRARRWVLGCGVALAGAVYAARAARAPEAALLERAITAAGGSLALGTARVLTWSGAATVFAGEERIELGVETTVEPFRYARADTWRLDKGRADLRSLEIDGEQGVLIKDGVRSRMPFGMWRHEREQYALYGLMRLVSLWDAGVRLEWLGESAAGPGLRIRHPQAPPTDFWFSPDARLVRARNVVDPPEGGGRIAQEIDFEGTIESAGVRWPRRLRISQSSKPYFELRLAAFRPRLAR